MYLATVIDLYSRRCLGYAMSAHHDQELTIASLRMAAATRGGRRPRTIFHTDRGGEYVGSEHAKACRRLGLVQSMAGSPRRWTVRLRGVVRRPDSCF